MELAPTGLGRWSLGYLKGVSLRGIEPLNFRLLVFVCVWTAAVWVTGRELDSAEFAHWTYHLLIFVEVLAAEVEVTKHELASAVQKYETYHLPVFVIYISLWETAVFVTVCAGLNPIEHDQRFALSIAKDSYRVVVIVAVESVFVVVWVPCVIVA